MVGLGLGVWPCATSSTRQLGLWCRTRMTRKRGCWPMDVFAKYDLIVLWWPTVGTVQRLSNALATGVPVIAKSSQVYIDTFGRERGILFAEDLNELGAHARALQQSPEFRLRTSDAGVAAASMFSRANISDDYLRFLKSSARAIRNATHRRACRTMT